MIFPVPKSFKPLEVFDRFPWTVTLVFLNALLYVMLFDQPTQLPQSKEQVSDEVSDSFILKAGHFYLEWQNMIQVGKQEQEILAHGSLAIRDMDFISQLSTWSSKVDPVGFELWKKEFEELFKKDDRSAINIFGLSQSKNSFWTWVTYQFAHSGSTHVMMNVLFLIFFGAVVEEMIGGFLMGIVYLIGGLMGGYFFMLMDSSGLIPLVGASASVTALIAFVAVGSLKKNIEYYFLPSVFIPDYEGRYYMSPLWIIPLALLGDLTAVISSPPGFSDGVSYSAHLGGAFAGLILGVSYKYGATRVMPRESSESFNQESK